MKEYPLLPPGLNPQFIQELVRTQEPCHGIGAEGRTHPWLSGFAPELGTPLILMGIDGVGLGAHLGFPWVVDEPTIHALNDQEAEKKIMPTASLAGIDFIDRLR
ncbi:MAG: hypothetical protein K2X80_13725 [Pseudomonadaceae bacterium]|nr:hypothetical protein [Pseudomonadaceae bacterium]